MISTQIQLKLMKVRGTPDSKIQAGEKRWHFPDYVSANVETQIIKRA
jgi:hypothetical protein